MKPNGNTLTLTVGRRENTHFQKPLSNGTPVPKLLNIFGWSFTVPMERWLLLMLQTCPNHLSKSPCELRFSRLLLPESQAECVLIQTGTPDSQVRFGQKGCISKTVVEKDAFIRGPLRGLYEVNARSVYMVCPGARHEVLKRDCSNWAGTCCENSGQLKHENISATDSFSQRNSGCRQTFWELNRHTFHHLLHLHYFPFFRIAFVHLAFISFILHSCSCFLYSCPFILIACLSILMIQGLACIIQCLWNAY